MVAIKIAGAAQNGFGCIVMKGGAKFEDLFLALNAPAGEGACRFPDVLLGVVTAVRGLAQREQLHHLTRKILVRRFLAAVGTVQINQHGRVFGHVVQQGSEAAKRIGPQQLLLAPHDL